MRAIVITEFGGPEVMNLTEADDPVAGEGQVVLDVSLCGINYADTHATENSYLAPTPLPVIPGGEVAGTTADGRRLVSFLANGGYAEKVAVNEALAHEIPDGVDDLAAVAMVVQGATAWLLLRRSTHMEPGESVLIHAAAGGVGSLAVQLAKAWGAGRVIAAASTDSKRQLALSLGADVAIDSNASDMRSAIKEANNGQGVDVILDMVGGRVTDDSVRALAPFGRLAYYGQASRQMPAPIQPASLLQHSTTIAGMWLPHALRLPGNQLKVAMTELFGLVAEGKLKAIAGGEYSLDQARQAHEDMRARKTSGKLVINPRL